MKLVKLFDEYITGGAVQRMSPDTQRAANIFLESERKYRLLQKTIDAMGVDDNNANDYVEYCYNIVMFLVRATMLTQGYTSSGQGAHEAEVAFSRNLGFSESEVQLLDQLRYFRNGILYYGKRFDTEYAQKIIAFTHKMYRFLKK